MSTGKTVVSKELAMLMNKALYDTDDMVEKELKLKITDIFSTYGEDYFREQESIILDKALGYNDSVISTGGGIILSEMNRRKMRANGIVISLIPDFSVIESRLSTAKATRPLLHDEIDNIYKRYVDRLSLYKECDIEINPCAGDSPESIAKYICERISK